MRYFRFSKIFKHKEQDIWRWMTFSISLIAGNQLANFNNKFRVSHPFQKEDLWIKQQFKIKIISLKKRKTRELSKEDLSQLKQSLQYPLSKLLCPTQSDPILPIPITLSRKTRLSNRPIPIWKFHLRTSNQGDNLSKRS